MSVFSYLYNRKAWKVLRAAHLREHPFCVKCLARGIHTLGTIVDHRIPHRGNMDLFFDPHNLQTLCPPDHSSEKQLEERHGFAPGADVNGEPTDPKHPWNRGRGG